jgi:hypothetical protein
MSTGVALGCLGFPAMAPHVNRQGSVKVMVSVRPEMLSVWHPRKSPTRPTPAGESAGHTPRSLPQEREPDGGGRVRGLLSFHSGRH